MIISDKIKLEFEELTKRIHTTDFFKVDMHVHTPGSSNDYKVGEKLYEQTSIDELIQIAIEKELCTKEDVALLPKNKDELMSLLIVHEAYKIKELDLMVITDHNTVEWFDKIRDALIEYINKNRHEDRMLYILPGVEITCFSGTHVIAILDSDKDKYKSQWNYIKYELVDRTSYNRIENSKVFTNRSEMDVIYTIRKAGGIVYVPHIDNNAAKMKIKDMLDKVNGSSKAQLFTSPYVQAIGLRNYEFKTQIESILNDKKHLYYRSTPLAYLQDSDAHDIDEIGQCYMYLKMEKPSFKSLKFALEDPAIRVREEIEEKKNIQRITGVVTRGGYLSKDLNKSSYYPFSNQMNCIIGGRGTGKSTLINCIKSCLEQRVNTIQFRSFMGEFNEIFIYLNDGKNNFCLYCKPKVLNDSYTNSEVRSYRDDNINALMDISSWIKMYKMTNKTCKVLSEEEKYEKLKSFYIDFYEQSEIMKIGENNEYILGLLTKIIERQGIGKMFNKKEKEIRRIKNNISALANQKSEDSVKKIEAQIETLYEEYQAYDEYYVNIISTLNETMNKKVKISYKREQNSLCNFFLDQLDKNYKVNNLQLKETEIVSQYISEKLNNESLSIIGERINSNNVRSEIKEAINANIQSVEDLEYSINIKECEEIIRSTYSMLLRNIHTIYDNVKVDLEFNVKSFDKKSSDELYKNIEVLSYGQKAVAILLIITEGMAEFNINIPLIIDQPEDQLDNTFIFETLVKEFRKLKENRQIILVTHNANIPVCGDAENIICLESDNEHGWIGVNGPLELKRVSEKVMSIMDGGSESFTLRNNKYKVLISKF